MASAVILNPPMVPVLAFTSPVMETDPLNKADDAVMSPLAFILNFEDEIKN